MKRGNDAAHHLLFGLPTSQTGLIDRSALMVTRHAWTQCKARPIVERHVDLGDLDAAHRLLLEGLAAAHLTRHRGEVERSLAALLGGHSTREGLANLGDSDFGGTLARASSVSTRQDGDSKSDHTANDSVGTAAFDGHPLHRNRTRPILHAEEGLFHR